MNNDDMPEPLGWCVSDFVNAVLLVGSIAASVFGWWPN